ncbi:MAG: AAA family ATPase [Armatimonadetes bacterium]|nr:AAA family ATPase [Armatimonadota bacterium]
MPGQPICIAITGRPGAGKTTLARELGVQLSFPVVSRDAIKEGYVWTQGVPHDSLPDDTNRLVTSAFFSILAGFLDHEVSVIVEGAFQHAVWESWLSPVLERARVVVVVCVVDPATAAQRHLDRGLAHPEREHFHGDHRVKHYRKTGEILPPNEYVAPELGVPTLPFRSDGQEGLVGLVAQLRELLARPDP